MSEAALALTRHAEDLERVARHYRRIAGDGPESAYEVAYALGLERAATYARETAKALDTPRSERLRLVERA